MTTTLSLSIDRILDSVYAHSAAEIVSTGAVRPEILGRDHRDMLKVMARDTIAGLAFSIAPLVTDSNIATTPIPDIITLEITIPDGVSQTMLRVAIETAIAAGILGQAWSGSESPMSGRYSSAYRMTVESIMRLTRQSSLPGAITPSA